MIKPIEKNKFGIIMESNEINGSPKTYIGGSLNTPIETNNSNINEIYKNKKPHIINIQEEALVFDIIKIAKKATNPPSNIFIIIKIISASIVLFSTLFYKKLAIKWCVF